MNPLIGKRVVFVRQYAHRAGIVRSVKGTKKEPVRTMRIQVPGGDAIVSGAGHSARCGGATYTVPLADALGAGCGILWHGKKRPLRDWIASRQ
jgi:hypothetical protein